KIDRHVYVKVLRYHVLPWLKANYPSGQYVWTQDEAPSHTSKLAQDFCSRNFADFWPANYWPPTSPDLSPLDFVVTPHPNVDSLKASITAAWANMSTDFIKKSCAAFRHRVDAVIDAKGGYIE
ncbi:Transposable element tcb1 transposase, partial [Caligus rogercresseyi]